MQFRNFFILTIICFFGCVLDANAQRVIENENGDRIIVYSDGSWKYYDENDPLDVELLNRITNAAQAPEATAEVPRPAPAPAPTRTRTKKSKSSKKKKSKTKVASTRKKNKKSSSLSSTSVLNVRTRIKKVQKVSQQKVSQAEYLEKQLSNNRDKLKKELSVGYNTEGISATKLASLKTNVDVATKKLKKAKKTRKNLVKYAKMADALNGKKGADQVQSLALLEGALGVKPKKQSVATTTQTQTSTAPPTATPPPANIPTNTTTTNQPVQNTSTESAFYNNAPPSQPVINVVRRKPSVKLTKYNSSQDVFLNPPTTKSKLAYNGVDEFTGKKRREVAQEMFFTHTSENLKSLLKGRDYLTCKAHISSQTGGMKILNLNFMIASDLAQQEFGIIDKGSILTIKLLDGATIKLINKKTDIGTVDPVNKTTEYNGQYIISNKDEKALTKSEVDKVRVVWSTGYEDYEVFELDFLIKQLKCITAK